MRVRPQRPPYRVTPDLLRLGHPLGVAGGVVVVGGGGGDKASMQIDVETDVQATGRKQERVGLATPKV